MARWRADAKELLYLSPDGSVMAADVIPGAAFQTTPPHPLFKMPLVFLGLSVNPGGLADVTRDHQKFLLTMPPAGSGRQDLNVVLNWKPQSAP